LVRRVDGRCGAKAGEIKALFNNTLDATRTAALREKMQRAGFDWIASPRRSPRQA
jgi:hypothetical protein